MPDDAKPPDAPLLKTQPPASGAGAGGWVPSKSTPIWAAIFVGIVSSAAPVLLQPQMTWNTVVAAVLIGAAGSLATYFGMRSAGPRRP